jgi:hypothetical protein
MSRATIIHMERRKGQLDRSVDRFDSVFADLRRKLARWMLDAGDLSQFRLPKNNSGAEFRDADNWESYYKVACCVSAAGAKQLLDHIPLFIDKEQDFDTCLLSSLREIFISLGQDNPDGFVRSETIVETLNLDKDAPWYKKEASKGITMHALGSKLGSYKVKAARDWVPDPYVANKRVRVRGYHYQKKDKPQEKTLKSVFDQYLPPSPSS